MGGSTKVIDTTAKNLRPLKQSSIDYLMGNPSGSNGGVPSTPVGVKPTQDMMNGVLYGQTPSGMPAGGPQPGMIPTTYGIDSLDRQQVERTGMDRINADAVQSTAPTAVPYGGDAAPVTFGSAPMIGQPDRGAVRDVGGQQEMFDMILRQFGQGGGQATAGQAQGVAEIGAATNPFFQRMMAQYQPAFTQGRTDALAQAKESMGNLTGSGAGNSLGKAVNRSLGQEQATLAELAKWGIGEELQRQLGNAGMQTQASIANAGNMMNAGVSLSGQRLQGQQANQNADLSFLDSLLRKDMANQGVQQQTNMAQGNADLQRIMQNQQLFQNTLNQGSAQGVQQGQFNAGQQNQMSAQNAQQFLQMLLGTLGNNNVAVQQNPGALGSILGAAAPIAGAFLGGPGGATVANKLF